MKIYNKPGTRIRLVEMMNQINNTNLEDINPNQLLNTSFENLLNGNLNVNDKQLNNNEDTDILELKCDDNSMFKFNINTTNDDIDGVFKINNAELVEFSNGSDVNLIGEELTGFNSQNSDKITEFVKNYVDFDGSEDNVNNKGVDDIENSSDIDEIDEYIDYLSKNKPEVVTEEPDNTELLNNTDLLNSQYNTISNEKKRFYISRAKEMLDLRITDNSIKATPQYAANIKEIAIQMFKRDVEDVNEESKYPSEIGHKFKTKKQYKLDKKKRQPITRIEEDDNFEKLVIGDVVTVDGWLGEFQIRVSYSDKKPYLAPYNVQGNEYKIYLSTLPQLKLSKVKGFSDTDGGFTNEDSVFDNYTPKNVNDINI